MKESIILLLSGEIGAGKSTLARQLQSDFGFIQCSTRRLLETATKGGKGRLSLQARGERLDRETRGEWVVREFHNEYYDTGDLTRRYVVDSIRIEDQINAFRASFGPRVVHVHLMASKEGLEARYFKRGSESKGLKELSAEYVKAKRNKTEQGVPALADIADLVINTERCQERDVAIKVASFLGLQSKINDRLVDVIVGCEYGSEGKGQIVGYLAPEYDALVRVGGPNAGHTVYAEPAPHVFHLLPSGSVRAPFAKLIIGPGAVLNVDTLLAEINKYAIDPKRVLVDENATIITRDDIEAEALLRKRIGSTAQGVGSAMANNIIRRGDSSSKNKAKFQKVLRSFLGSACDEFERLFSSGRRILVEGTQGTALSLYHGHYPYVTARDTTACGVLSEAGIGPGRLNRVIMVTRTYPIRVQSPNRGTSGAFDGGEISWDVIAERSGLDLAELVKREITTTTKRQRRVGEFSWHLYRRACELNSPTDIALTFVDYLSATNKNARRFEQLEPNTIDFIQELELVGGADVSLISTRFEHRCIIDRRKWRRS